MSKIKLNLPEGEFPANGKQVSFVAPCGCADADCIHINGIDYALVDSRGNNVAGVSGLWATGSIVSVILDVIGTKAYVQNSTYATTSGFTGTLLSNGWSNSIPYTQTITIDGLHASDEPFIDVDLSGITDATVGVTVTDNWLRISRATVSADNGIGSPKIFIFGK